MSTLGQRLKFLRKIHNKTQAEIGEVLGVKKAAISSYENDISLPSTQKIVELAKYFGVNVSYIIGDINKMHAPNKEYTTDQKAPLITEDIVLDLPEHIAPVAIDYISVPSLTVTRNTFAVKMIYDNISVIVVATREKTRSKLVLCEKDGKLCIVQRDNAKKEELHILGAILLFV